MITELLRSIDKGAYYAFSEAVKGSPELVQPLHIGEWALALLIAVLACVLLLTHGRARAAALVAVAMLIGTVGVEAIRYTVPVHRPDNAARVVDSAEMARSFPAGEVFTFTLAGTLLIYAAWTSLHGWLARVALTAVVVVLILGVAMSELLLVLHFVTDVAAGLFGGLALALVVTRLIATLPARQGEAR